MSEFGEWAYLPNGVMTHLLQRSEDGLSPWGACGIEPNDGDGWHGTGSQAERDEAAFLPHCRVCCVVLAGGGLS